MKERGPVIKVIVVVLHLVVEVTYGEVITISLADLFIPLYQHLRHSSSSSLHTSQVYSFRLVGREGHSGYSGSSDQPTSRRSCFECADMGYFLRDFPTSRSGGLHHSSKGSTFMTAQPPTRGIL